MPIANLSGLRRARARRTLLLPLAAAAVAAPWPRALAAQPATPAATLDAPARARIVDSVARVLQSRYVDAAIAARLAARLRERVAAGAYDAVAEPAALGVAMMRDLQAVVPDKHLRLTYEPGQEFGLGGPAPGPGGARRVVPGGAPPPNAVAPGTGAAGPRREAIDGRDSVQLARINFGFQRVERLPGNVGYLKLAQFFPLPFARPTASAAMAFLAGSDAVIVDLRDNIGGSPDMVEFLLSYFFGPEPVLLTTVYGRFADVRLEHRTLRELPGERLAGAELFVLTNANSASSAEMFAYAARRLERATLVGENTAGAGNGGAKLSVGGGLALFVPQFQVISGPGYERTGVAPHVAVPGDDALPVALDSALARLVAKAPTPELRRERAWALEWTRAERGALAPSSDPRRYAGRYGARNIVAEGGTLWSVGATGQRTRLLSAGEHAFRSRDARLRFELDPSGGATLVVETLAGVSTRTVRERKE